MPFIHFFIFFFKCYYNLAFRLICNLNIYAILIHGLHNVFQTSVVRWISDIVVACHDNVTNHILPFPSFCVDNGAPPHWQLHLFIFSRLGCPSILIGKDSSIHHLEKYSHIRTSLWRRFVYTCIPSFAFSLPLNSIERHHKHKSL